MPRTERRWKMIIILCLAGFLAATATSMFLAASRVSRVVDSDYYSHGLHYATPATGLVMRPELRRQALEVSVRDSNGAPVSGGRLEYRTQPVAGSPALRLALTESAPGFYRADCSATGGDLRGTLCFSKGATVLNSKMVVLR